MAESKCLSGKYEDLSLNLQHTHRQLDTAAHSVTVVLRSQRQEHAQGVLATCYS